LINYFAARGINGTAVAHLYGVWNATPPKKNIKGNTNEKENDDSRSLALRRDGWFNLTSGSLTGSTGAN
jgi:hypothetical protein